MNIIEINKLFGSPLTNQFMMMGKTPNFTKPGMSNVKFGILIGGIALTIIGVVYFMTKESPRPSISEEQYAEFVRRMALEQKKDDSAQKKSVKENMGGEKHAEPKTA